MCINNFYVLSDETLNISLQNFDDVVDKSGSNFFPFNLFVIPISSVQCAVSYCFSFFSIHRVSYLQDTLSAAAFKNLKIRLHHRSGMFWNTRPHAMHLIFKLLCTF
jgi:hypothetical protein